MDFAANRSTVAANRLRSLKRLTRELSLSTSDGVDVRSAPQQGTVSVGRQLVTLVKISVAKYFIHSPWQPKWSQLGALYMLHYYSQSRVNCRSNDASSELN